MVAVSAPDASVAAICLRMPALVATSCWVTARPNMPAASPSGRQRGRHGLLGQGAAGGDVIRLGVAVPVGRQRFRRRARPLARHPAPASAPVPALAAAVAALDRGQADLAGFLRQLRPGAGARRGGGHGALQVGRGGGGDPVRVAVDQRADQVLDLDDVLRLVNDLAGEPGVLAGPGEHADLEFVGCGRPQRRVEGFHGPRLVQWRQHHATPVLIPRASSGAAPWLRKPHCFGSPLPQG